MSSFKTVASYENNSQRAYGQGLFAGPDVFRLAEARNSRATVAKCMIENLVFGEVRSTGHEVEVNEPFGISIVVPLKGTLVSETHSETHKAVGQSQGLLFSPNRRRTRVVAPTNGDFVGMPVIVPISEIAQAAERMGVPPSQVRRAKSFSIEFGQQSLQSSEALLNLCMGLRSEIAHGSRRLNLPGAHTQWRNIIAEKVVEMLDEAGVLRLPRVAQHSTEGRHVDRAMEYMRAQYFNIVLISEVAEACNVSSRTLELAFKREMGLTPMQVLTTFRLDEAYATLRNPDNDTTVTDVALACGFRHLGRFSRVYRDRFGEMPSESRARG